MQKLIKLFCYDPLVQAAMVLTCQKPTQRNRFSEVSEGLPGSTLERGMCGEKRQELGSPWRFLNHWRERGMLLQEIRILSHERGNLETEVGRTLHAAEVALGK